MLLHLNLYLVESLAIYADNATLTDEGARVDHLYQSEDEHRFALLGKQTYHLHLLACVPAVAVEDCECMVGLACYGFGYLLVFLREYHELHRLALHVHHIVEHSTFDDHRTQTEYHHLATLWELAERVDDETAAYDYKVYHDEYFAKRNVVVLVNYGCNDVGSARTAVVEEHYCQRRSGEHTSYNERHEVVALTHQLVEGAVGLLHNLLCEFEQYGKCNGGIYGLGKEFQSKFLQRGYDKYGIDDEESPLNGELCGIEDNGSYTCNTSSYNFVWQKKNGKSEGIEHQTKCDIEIILRFLPDNFTVDCHWIL